MPDEVKAAIKAAKRQVQGPVDDYGQPTWIDVEGDVHIAPDQTTGWQT